MNTNLSKKIAVFNFLLLVFYTQAEIIEIKNFNEILNYVAPEALVLLDIDNTLIEPTNPDQIGSDQWSAKIFKEITPLQVAHDLYYSTVLECPMQLTEATVPGIIHEIQARAQVLGFTMRSIILAPCTLAQLALNQINLPICYKNRGFMVEGKHPAMMYENVIFCQGRKNGDTLFAVLDSYDTKPTAIVMVDDKRRYLEDIETTCALRGIKFIGLRYGYLDAKVAEFIKNQEVCRQ